MGRRDVPPRRQAARARGSLLERKIHFWARGDANTYRLLFFAKSSGPRPFGADFKVASDWREYEFTLSNLGGTLDDVTAVLFAGGPWQGAFTLEIDDVRFE